jgi:hypothetical protein
VRADGGEVLGVLLFGDLEELAGAFDEFDADDEGGDLSAVGQGGIVRVSAGHGTEVEVAPFKDNGRLVAKGLEVAAKLVQRDTGLNRHGEVGLVDREDLVHLLVGQNNVATDEARRDGVHGSDDFDFGILSVGIFDDGLDFADAAGFLELGVWDVEFNLVVPVDKLRHFCGEMKCD